jgi:hypothetical protein
MNRIVRIVLWLLFVVFFTLLPQIAVMINASMTGKPPLDLIKLSEQGEFYIFAAAISAHAVGRVVVSLLRDSANGAALHVRMLVIVAGLVVVFIASLSYMAFLANKGLASQIDLWFLSRNSIACAVASFGIGIGVMLVEEEE